MSPELEEESIIIVYAGLETGLYATNMERGGELRVFELPGRAFIFGFIEERYKFSSKSQPLEALISPFIVVVATAKVQIFKQITTVTKR